MRFETVILVLMVPLVVATFWLIRRSLATGRFGTGAEAIKRSEQPIEFWFQTISAGVAVSAIFATMLYDQLVEDLRHWPITSIFFGIVATFWFVRSLQTGSTGMADLKLERSSDPILYWLFMGLTILFITLQLFLIFA